MKDEWAFKIVQAPREFEPRGTWSIYSEQSWWWGSDAIVRMTTILDEGELRFEFVGEIPSDPRHWLPFELECVGLDELIAGVGWTGRAVIDFLLKHAICPGQDFWIVLSHWASDYWTDCGREYDSGVDVGFLSAVPFKGDPARAWAEVLESSGPPDLD